MHAKVAGHLSLQDMIENVISGSRAKLAAFEEKEKEKDDKKDDKKEKKLPPFMMKNKKEDKDEDKDDEKEKVSSVIDTSDPDEIEKLASALEYMSEKLAAYNGGESHQGGEQLENNNQVGGKQPYKKDSSKSHNVPTSTPLKAKSDNGSASTATEDTEHDGHIPVSQGYPKKGVLKTAASSVKDKIEKLKNYEEKEHGHIPSVKEEEDEKKEKKSAVPPAFLKNIKKKEDKGDKDEKDEKKEPKENEEEEKKEKKSAAAEYIAQKIAAFSNVEKKMGGETLDSAAEQGPKPPGGAGGNNVRNHIGSNKAAIDMKKVEGKAPQKKMLAEVLTEPALSAAHDSKVQENLRNASKGGIKIAATKAFLQKIAEEGCTCSGHGECKYCKMKHAMEKKSSKQVQSEAVN